MRVGNIVILISILQASVVASFCRPQKDGSKCVPVENVLTLLAKYKTNRSTYPQKQIISLIKEYGYCGRPTESELEKIRRAGALPELMTAIEEATREAPPPPPPAGPKPPPPPKEGSLRVLCQPVYCSITVNGKTLGASTSGEYATTFPVGLITVGAARQDYDVDPKLQNVEVKDGVPTTVVFKMTVSRAALEAAGARLFGRMVDALGGPDGLKSLGFFKAAGTLTCYDRAGQPQPWEVTTTIKLPDKAKFELSRTGSKTKYEVVNTDRGMEWSKVDEKDPKLAELNLALGRFQEQQIARTVGSLRNGGFKMVAASLNANPGEDSVLLAEGGGLVYRITVGADMRPREILLQSGGLDKGLKVLYSEYVERGGAAYPLNMEIQYRDGEPHGVAAKLRSVELNPANVKDADFTPKKKGRILGIL